MNCRTGCLIFAILFTLMFVFSGMLCRITLPISPDPSRPQIERLELHGMPDVVD